MRLNWLERTIGTVSPQWAYKRKAWRSAMDAFDSGSRRGVNTNWNPHVADGQIQRAERELIRARAQDLERNSDIVQSILTALERNIVGSGIMLQSKVSRDNVDSEELNNQIEKLWREFSKAENCDVTGTQSMEEIEEAIIRRFYVDGGIFIVKVYVQNSQFPFKIQLRSVDELNTLLFSSENHRVIDGIELDEYNKPIAYHFKKFEYTGTNLIAIPHESIRVKAEDAIFLFKKNTPQQIREISQLATAIPRIRDANQFMEAVSIKERVLACLSVFIKKSTPTGNVGRGFSSSNGEKIDYDGVSLSPGMIGELNPGDEVQTVIPSGQASNTREFITTLVRLVASGVGLSYEAVSRDLSQVNYSSARQGLIEDKKTYKRLQKMLVDKFLTPIYLEFLRTAYLQGQLQVKDFFRNTEKYTSHVWIPPGSQWIDPGREVNAYKTALESNQDTLSRICAERGEDWKEVIQQRAAETKLINELMGGVMNGTNATNGTVATDNNAN